jgi:ribosomal protein S8
MVCAPIPDFCSRFNVSLSQRRRSFKVINSKLIRSILKILLFENYISSFCPDGTQPHLLEVYLKYSGDGEPVVKKLIPSRIRREPIFKLDTPLSKLEQGRTFLLSTDKGLCLSRDAYKLGVGGKIFITIFT